MLVLILMVGWFSFQNIDEQVVALDQELIEEILLQEEFNEIEVEENHDTKDESGEEIYHEDLNLDLSSQREEITSSNKDFWNKYYNSDENNINDSSIVDAAEVTAKFKNTKISTTDKLKALYIIKRNLSNEDISYIVSLTKDGVTSQEKDKIKNLLGEKLSEKDYEQLKSMVFKYL